MKKIAFLLSIAMLFTLGNAPMGGSKSEVTLNASQVTSASDIESAIETAKRAKIFISFLAISPVLACDANVACLAVSSTSVYQQFTIGSTWTLKMNLAGGVVSVKP